MKKFFKNYKRLSIKILIGLFFVFIVVLFSLLKLNQGICEWWTRNFTSGWVVVFGHLTRWIPFSITEILGIIAIGLIIFYLVKVIIRLCKRKWIRSLSSLTNIFLIIFFALSLYFVTAEMAYNREAMPIELYNQKVEKTKFKEICEYFIEDWNYCASQLEFEESGKIKKNINFNEMNAKCIEEYKRLTDPYFNSFTTNCKPMFTSFIYRECHITGVTFVPTGEANINYLGTEAEFPVTFMHELAHTKGVMREEDAVLLSNAMCLTSSDPYFRYSGYIYTMSSLLDLGSFTGVDTDYNDLVNQISPIILKNMNYEYDYWQSHRFFLDVAEWFNNLYLKISGEPNGTGSYDDTPIIIDPSSREITSFSMFQKLYFQIYYSQNN